MFRALAPISIAIATFCIVTTALAQAPGRPGPGQRPRVQPDSFSLGLGIALAPRFPGDDDYVLNPFPLITWVKNGRTLRNNGFGFEYDLTKGSQLDYGPIVRFNTGRDDLNSVNDPVVEALGKVSFTAEVGGFIGITRPIRIASGKPLLLNARASAVQAVSGHDGFIIEGSAGIVRPSRKWITSVSANVSYASGNFHDAFFSVNAAQSQASGLAEFDADAGLRDVGVASFVRYNINQTWALNAIASYSRLLGDAADNPIVEERGSANQAFLGLNVSYTWR
ncbi:MAG: MipA/OmpV family protein [Pseudomonadota bacterium]